jgi:hypothetical protein
MEHEMNSENWTQPSENQFQQDTYPQPEQSQQDWLQKSWLNVKIETWLQFILLLGILLFATGKIVPMSTSAQPRQQSTWQSTNSYYSEYENECFDDYEDQYYDEYYYED